MDNHKAELGPSFYRNWFIWTYTGSGSTFGIEVTSAYPCLGSKSFFPLTPNDFHGDYNFSEIRKEIAAMKLRVDAQIDLQKSIQRHRSSKFPKLLALCLGTYGGFQSIDQTGQTEKQFLEECGITSGKTKLEKFIKNHPEYFQIDDQGCLVYRYEEGADDVLRAADPELDRFCSIVFAMD